MSALKGGNGNEISTLTSRNAHNNKKANYCQIQIAYIFGHVVLFPLPIFHESISTQIFIRLTGLSTVYLIESFSNDDSKGKENVT